MKSDRQSKIPGPWRKTTAIACIVVVLVTIAAYFLEAESALATVWMFFGATATVAGFFFLYLRAQQ